MGGTTKILVSESTLDELDELRDDGEDYDDVLQELIAAADRGADFED